VSSSENVNQESVANVFAGFFGFLNTIGHTILTSQKTDPRPCISKNLR
jgi:hypothetical protein